MAVMHAVSPDMGARQGDGGAQTTVESAYGR